MDKHKLIMSVIVKHRSNIMEIMDFCFFKNIVFGFYFEN